MAPASPGGPAAPSVAVMPTSLGTGRHVLGQSLRGCLLAGRWRAPDTAFGAHLCAPPLPRGVAWLPAAEACHLPPASARTGSSNQLKNGPGFHFDCDAFCSAHGVAPTVTRWPPPSTEPGGDTHQCLAGCRARAGTTLCALGTCRSHARVHHGDASTARCRASVLGHRRTCTQETSPWERRAFPHGAGIGGGKLFPFLLPEASAAKRAELIYCCPPRWRPGRRPFACCAAELKAEVRTRQVAEDDTPAPMCHLRTTSSPLWLHSPRCGLGVSGPLQRALRPSATGD